MNLLERENPNLAKKAITEESVAFEYPAEPADEETKEFVEKFEKNVRDLLIRVIGLNPYDFVVFQQRLLYRRNAREIGSDPLMPYGRMAVISKCRQLAKKFPMFRQELLAGFGKKDAKHDNPKTDED